MHLPQQLHNYAFHNFGRPDMLMLLIKKTIWAQPIKNKEKLNKQNKTTTHNYRWTKIKYQPQKPKKKKGGTFTHKTGPGLTGPSQSPAPKQHSLSVQLRKDAVEDMLLPSPPPSTA